MKKPRSITEAHKLGYVTKRAIAYQRSVNVIMEPRFFNSGMKSKLNFWITFLGAKRLGINYN